MGIALLTQLALTRTQSGGSAGISPLARLAPEPADNPTTPEKVALGRQLFFDPRLSGDNRTSCATCHLPDHAFSDGLKRTRGTNVKLPGRNTPSLLNVGFYPVYFWDGRVASLEEQALIPIQSADEMNQNIGELERELDSIPGYATNFRLAFGSGTTRENIAWALASFERTLISGTSPFDRFLAGDGNALSEEARRGWTLFKGAAGCIRCHNGASFSDGRFYRLGVGLDDKGRGAITGNKADLFAFRTPGLRDVARTAPYMHDGSFDKLFEVVEFYYRGVPARSQDGLPVHVQPLSGQSYAEISDIVAFLESLTGEIQPISTPKLP